MENVGEALSSEAYSVARTIFKNCAYGLNERVLDASLCGVPQKRRRLFVVGVIGERDGFLNAEIESRLAEKPLSVREYLTDEISFTDYYMHPRNYNRRAVFSIDEPSPTIRGVNRPVARQYPGHKRDTAPFGSVDRLPTEIRSRIQSFPKEYIWKGSRSAVEQMIGNAVPPELGAFVARCLTSRLEAVRTP